MPWIIGFGASQPYSRGKFQETLWERFRSLSGIFPEFLPESPSRTGGVAHLSPTEGQRCRNIIVPKFWNGPSWAKKLYGFQVRTSMCQMVPLSRRGGGHRSQESVCGEGGRGKLFFRARQVIRWLSTFSLLASFLQTLCSFPGTSYGGVQVCTENCKIWRDPFRNCRSAHNETYSDILSGECLIPPC